MSGDERGRTGGLRCVHEQQRGRSFAGTDLHRCIGEKHAASKVTTGGTMTRATRGLSRSRHGSVLCPASHFTFGYLIARRLKIRHFPA